MISEQNNSNGKDFKKFLVASSGFVNFIMLY